MTGPGKSSPLSESSPDGRPGRPAADVAAVLATLIAARDIGVYDLARQAGCTASHLSHLLHRHGRPSRPGHAAQYRPA
jgi:hypothetical protein